MVFMAALWAINAICIYMLHVLLYLKANGVCLILFSLELFDPDLLWLALRQSCGLKKAKSRGKTLFFLIIENIGFTLWPFMDGALICQDEKDLAQRHKLPARPYL